MTFGWTENIVHGGVIAGERSLFKPTIFINRFLLRFAIGIILLLAQIYFHRRLLFQLLLIFDQRLSALILVAG